MCGLSAVSPSYMECTASTYGADSLTNRRPAPLTMTQPGRFPSARQKYGPRRGGGVGPPPAVSVGALPAARRLAGNDPAAGVAGPAGRPVGPDRRPLVLAAHLRVAL